MTTRWTVVAGPFTDTKGHSTYRAVNGARVVEMTIDGEPTDEQFDKDFAFAVVKAKSLKKL